MVRSCDGMFEIRCRDTGKELEVPPVSVNVDGNGTNRHRIYCMT